MFYSYILKSQKDNSYYYGSCQNLLKRVDIHNKGKSRYTKSKRPWILIYFEEFNSRSEAYRRELFFKSIDGYKWLKANNII